MKSLFTNFAFQKAVYLLVIIGAYLFALILTLFIILIAVSLHQITNQ